MKTSRIAVLAAAAALLALPAFSETAGELLQRGIYNQDTAGNTDAAINIYRQIIGSGNSPRDIAAQAQYRLAQSLLEKGDLSNGATEFSNLARNYADYAKLISSLAAQAGRSLNPPPGAGRGGSLDAEQIAKMKMAIENLRTAAVEADAKHGAVNNLNNEQRLAELDRLQANLEAALSARAFDLTFDFNNPLTLRGTIFKLEILRPNSFISVDPQDGSGKRYTFVLSGPALPSRKLVRMGDQVSIIGALATGGQFMPDGTIAAVATTITNANGEKIYERGQVTQ